MKRSDQWLFALVKKKLVRLKSAASQRPAYWIQWTQSTHHQDMECDDQAIFWVSYACLNARHRLCLHPVTSVSCGRRPSITSHSDKRLASTLRIRAQQNPSAV